MSLVLARFFSRYPRGVVNMPARHICIQRPNKTFFGHASLAGHWHDGDEMERVDLAVPVALLVHEYQLLSGVGACV